VDQKKSFGFRVADIDAAMAMVGDPLDANFRRAAYAVGDTVDAYVAGIGAAGAGLTYGTNSVPIAVNSANVLSTIATLAEKLRDANVPTGDLFLVVPPWFHTKMVLAKILTASDNVGEIVNGAVARFYGFDIRLSNNVPNTSSTLYKILAGSKMGITYAGKLTKLEAGREEKNFSDFIKGLYVYGAKVIQPNALVCLTANVAAEP
jgi:hypothetical protein